MVNGGVPWVRKWSSGGAMDYVMDFGGSHSYTLGASEPHIDLDGFWPRGVVTSYRPYARLKGSEPHIDLDGDSPEEELPQTLHRP